jgi:mRNA-degrading endonuclease RelE of RelBE toxin-antitoxin system
VDDALLLLYADAFAGTQLRGNLRGRWKLKVGRVRILYRIRENGALVIVDAVVYRDQAYPTLGH